MFSSDHYKKCYFSKKIDNLIIENYIKFLKKNNKKNKILFFDKKKKTIKRNTQIILTHYRLRNDSDDNLGTGSLDFCKPQHHSLRKLNAGNFLYEDLLNYVVRNSSKKFFKKKATSQINKVIIMTSPEMFFNNQKIIKASKLRNMMNNFFFKKKKLLNFLLLKKKIKNFEKNTKSKISFLYENNGKLNLIESNKKQKIIFNNKNLSKIIDPFNLIVCGENYLSILVNLYYSNKRRVILYSSGPNKKIIENNKKLFVNDPEFTYLDIFKDRFTNHKELILSEFKNYIDKV